MYFSCGKSAVTSSAYVAVILCFLVCAAYPLSYVAAASADDSAFVVISLQNSDSSTSTSIVTAVNGGVVTPDTIDTITIVVDGGEVDTSGAGVVTVVFPPEEIVAPAATTTLSVPAVQCGPVRHRSVRKNNWSERLLSVCLKSRHNSDCSQVRGKAHVKSATIAKLQGRSAGNN